MTSRDQFLQEFRTEVTTSVLMALEQDRRRRNWQAGWIAFAVIMALGVFVTVAKDSEPPRLREGSTLTLLPN